MWPSDAGSGTVRSGPPWHSPTLDSGQDPPRSQVRNLAGSHRAERPPSRRSPAIPRWAVAVAVVVALVPAAVLTAHRVFSSTGSPDSHANDLPIPAVSPSATTTGTTTPTATPTAAPTKTPTAAPRLPRVAPAAPRRITSGKLLDAGFDSAATDLDASSNTEVARWESRGSPGSPGRDTVYVFGRVRAGGAFARLAKLGAGSRVVIRTDNGTMTYTVSAATLEPESGLRKDPLFRQHRAGRLVLVGIRYDDSGSRLGKALVVTAQLSGARRA
jgi:hypothetical protein